ncbi:MAG: CRTAC1 family protein [Acidobacteriota bacterium]
MIRRPASAALAATAAIVAIISTAPGRVSRAAPPLFVEAAAGTGLTFTHVSGASGNYYLAEEMGAGVALFDYDNDGDLDVFLVQGGSLDPPTPGAAVRTRPTSRLFRNDLKVAPDGTRTLHFTDVTEKAGIHLDTYGMGAAVGDYDNDGYLDLLVTSFGPETLYHNNGNGTFTDVTRDAGVSDPQWSTSAAFVDYDHDGDLDLFVANYLDFTVANNKRCADPTGARDYCGPRSYRPVMDRLYRNEGHGRFTDATAAAGIGRAYGAGLGVAIGDYNGDGWPDIYVANDATPNQLWINQRDGTFADQGLLSGAALNAAGNPEGSMGIASGDYDRDGDEDLFVTNLAAETAVLYANDGHASFEDVRARAGLAAATAGFTGFATDWLDYDNDGWLDLFTANGGVNVIEAQRGQPFPFLMKNQLFRNLGTGRFEDTSATAGPAFAQPGIGRGAAFGDLDNDGDIDIVVTSNNGPVRLLLNQSPAGAHWLSIRLTQQPNNRFGVGAWIGVEGAGHPTLWRRVRTDGSYLSASDIRTHVGLGTRAPGTSAVVVQWPDGPTERWTGVEADRVVTLARGTGKMESAGSTR